MTEETLQKTLVSMLKALYPDLLISLSMSGVSLNGSVKQNAQTMKSLVAQGFVRGLPDIVIYLPNAQVLNLELKRPRGGSQSPDQLVIQHKLEALGHNYFIIRDIYYVFKLIAERTSTNFRKSQHTQFINSKQQVPVPVEQLYNF